MHICFIKFLNASFQNKFIFHKYMFLKQIKKNEISIIRDIIVLISYIFNAM